MFSFIKNTQTLFCMCLTLANAPDTPTDQADTVVDALQDESLNLSEIQDLSELPAEIQETIFEKMGERLALQADIASELWDIAPDSSRDNPKMTQQKTVQFIVHLHELSQGRTLEWGIDGRIGGKTKTAISSIVPDYDGGVITPEIMTKLIDATNAALSAKIAEIQAERAAAEAAEKAAEEEKTAAQEVVAAFDAEANWDNEEKVEKLQTALKTLGYELKGNNDGVDGIMGGSTQEAFLAEIQKQDESNLSALEDVYSQAQEAFEAADSALAAATQAVESAEAAHNTKNDENGVETALADAEAAVATAEANLADAEAALTAAKEDFEAAQQEKNGAQKNRDDILNRYGIRAGFHEAEEVLADAETALEDAEDALTTAEAALTAAQTALEDAEAAVTTAQTAKDEYDAELERLREVHTAAASEFATKTSEFESANSAREAARNNLEKARLASKMIEIYMQSDEGVKTALQEGFNIDPKTGITKIRMRNAIANDPQKAISLLSSYVTAQDTESLTARLESEAPAKAEAINADLATLRELIDWRIQPLVLNKLSEIAKTYTGETVSADERNANAQYIVLKLQEMNLGKTPFAQQLLEAIMAEGKGDYTDTEKALTDALYHGSGRFATHLATFPDTFGRWHADISHTLKTPDGRKKLEENMSQGIEGSVVEVMEELVRADQALLTKRLHILTGQGTDGSVDMSLELAGAMQLKNAYYDEVSGAIYATMKNGCEGNLVVIPIQR